MTDLPFLPHLNSVLVIEDNAYLQQLLLTSLANAEYNVITNSNGNAVPQLIEKHDIDLILLDLILPKKSGKEVVEEVRTVSDVPIIILSALADPDCLVECLALGADEFIAKPFSFNILMARVEALLRRMEWNNVDDHKFRQHEIYVELDNIKNEVVIEGRRERLTPQEYRVLQYFVRHPNSIVSSETLMQEIWETDCLSDTLISSMVRRLRSKIESKPSEPQLLQTVWGRGYRFCTVKT